jgi:hypothetical protein
VKLQSRPSNGVPACYCGVFKYRMRRSRVSRSVAAVKTCEGVQALFKKFLVSWFNSRHFTPTVLLIGGGHRRGTREETVNQPMRCSTRVIRLLLSTASCCEVWASDVLDAHFHGCCDGVERAIPQEAPEREAWIAPAGFLHSTILLRLTVIQKC